MNSYLLKSIYGISSSSIEKFLLLTGWTKDYFFKNKNILLFKNVDDPLFTIAVPSNSNIIDYYDRIYDVIQNLCKYYNKEENDIITSLKNIYSDRIQFRIITEKSKDGKLPLDYAARCIDGLRNLVLYAACAEENAKPICRRTCASAISSTEKFQFGQTELGSYVFNIDVQVVDEKTEQIFFTDKMPLLSQPAEHKIIKRIERAFDQIEEVVTQQTEVSRLIENAYTDGITANMCDALMQIKPEDGKDINLESSIFYAEAITHSISKPKIRTFNNVHFAFIDDISNRYKDYTLVEDMSLTGIINMLQKNNYDEDLADTIRLLTVVEGKARSIDLHLSQANHNLACNAYRDGKEVTITGTVDKSGRHWFFSEVVNFLVMD